jgi:hypothetical protein
MSLTKISVAVSGIPPAICVLLMLVRTLTLIAFRIWPLDPITSSGLWPEKMCVLAFQTTVRVWLLLVSPPLPPLASARLSLSALRLMRVMLFVTLT